MVRSKIEGTVVPNGILRTIKTALTSYVDNDASIVLILI